MGAVQFRSTRRQCHTSILLTVSFFSIEPQLLVRIRVGIRVQCFRVNVSIHIESKGFIRLLRITEVEIFSLHVGLKGMSIVMHLMDVKTYHVRALPYASVVHPPLTLSQAC